MLITLDFKDGGASPVRGVGANIFGPIERVTHDVTDPVASVFDSITGGPSEQGTITSLQRQNAELRAELSAAQLNKSARKQLAQLLQLDAGGYRIVTANVIAAGGGFSDTVTLAGSGEIGAVTGTGKSLSGSAMLRLSLFDANAVLHPGQQVVSYASVGNKPQVPGVPVGTIVSVSNNAGALTQTAIVRPAVSFTSLGVVGVVVQVPRHGARISIEPRPAPTVTVTATPSPPGTVS